MFYWNGWDGVLTPRTLQTPTFLRNSIATFIDSEGRVARVAADQARWYRHLETGLFGVIVEGGPSTNLCLRSDDFANWTAVNTPSLVANALRLGVLPLTLLIDDSGVNQEYYQRTDVNLSGGTCVASAFVKAGTVQPAAGSQIILIDSAVATRLDMTVTWSAGVPVLTPTTGTFLGKVQCADGAYRLLFKTNANPAAGNATIRIIPAKTAAQQGNLYCGGVQIENNQNTPTQYIPTTTATVTRAGEVFYWPFLSWVRGVTLYVQFVDLGSGASGGTSIYIGDAATPAWLRVESANTPITNALVDPGSGSVTATVAAGSSFGQLAEMRASVTKAGLITVGYAVSGGSESTGTAQGGALPDNSLWGVQRVVAGLGNGGGPILLNRLAVYPGILTMDQLRKRG